MKCSAEEPLRLYASSCKRYDRSAMEQAKGNAGGEIIPFLRKKDYVLVRELGQGACGKTILLHDDTIDQDYVCKKYQPYEESQRQNLYAGFVREVKLLHKLHHANVVRVFNHYLYPESCAGYILMEFIDGLSIDEYAKKFPDHTSDLFVQAVNGFAYLEQSGILHRDIRPQNIMVNDAGTLKIIDLGFGKQVETSTDFGKSISLNWWCATPLEFADGRYDFCSEVYFVGKLFDRLLEDPFNDFRYTKLVERMCERDPTKRTPSFASIVKEIGNGMFAEIAFDDDELAAYRAFSGAIVRRISKITSDGKYVDDINRVKAELTKIYRGCMLEVEVPDPNLIVRAIVDSTYYFNPRVRIEVCALKGFVQLLQSSNDERCRTLLANLHSRLDAIPRHVPEEQPPGDDIPF